MVEVAFELNSVIKRVKMFKIYFFILMLPNIEELFYLKSEKKSADNFEIAEISYFCCSELFLT